MSFFALTQTLISQIGLLIQTFAAIPVAFKPANPSLVVLPPGPGRALQQVPMFDLDQIVELLNDAFPDNGLTSTQIQKALLVGTRRGVFLFSNGHVLQPDGAQTGDGILRWAFNPQLFSDDSRNYKIFGKFFPLPVVDDSVPRLGFLPCGFDEGFANKAGGDPYARSGNVTLGFNIGAQGGVFAGKALSNGPVGVVDCGFSVNATARGGRDCGGVGVNPANGLRQCDNLPVQTIYLPPGYSGTTREPGIASSPVGNDAL